MDDLELAKTYQKLGADSYMRAERCREAMDITTDSGWYQYFLYYARKYQSQAKIAYRNARKAMKIEAGEGGMRRSQ